ncbi:hypothetical protein B0J17DRAFT_706291 [Rhizoctonia solani]|nr:hypothetical protein B0J17DRAFT_706291 [Rhizoctonia solani]
MTTPSSATSRRCTNDCNKTPHSELSGSAEHHIARELYNDGILIGNSDDTADLLSLSMSSKSWHFASLPWHLPNPIGGEDLYYHCDIGGRGNFAIENWLTRILPRYGQFTKSIDVALCWTHINFLPEREKEHMKPDQGDIASPWDNARGELVAQLVSNLPNLSAVKLAMLQCTAAYESNECTCAGRFGRIVQAFKDRRFQSMAFHGLATTFCPRLAQLTLTSSASSVRSVAFSDGIDGSPSILQPFEQICQLPVVTHMTFAAASFHAHGIESLPWICPLEAIKITNETMDRIVQSLTITQMSMFLRNFASSLSSLAFHNVAIDRQGGTGKQFPSLPYLTHVVLHSTQESTFQTLELLEAHPFGRLSIVVAPMIKPNLLLGALLKGAFPGLKEIEIHLNPRDHWSSSAHWDLSIRAAVQAVCNERHITLAIFADESQKGASAKVRVRRRVPADS